MNMKCTLTGLFCFGIITGSIAQTSDAEADAIINLLGVQKKEAVSKLVPVSGQLQANMKKN